MNISVLKSFLPSDPRPEGVKVDTIVMHSTAGREKPSSSIENARSTLEKRKLSYHYIIARDGTVYKCAPVGRAARHAGSSYGPHEQRLAKSMVQYVYNQENRAKGRVHKFLAGTSVNPYTIGISFVNMNDGSEDYPAAQVEAAKRLVALLKAAIPELEFVTTHYEVSPKRKSDPFGEGFDLDDFASAVGLQAWKFPDRARVGRP
jgi:N-acetyl-anhydromuramyl-L-alanine amidase AmpD